MRKILAYSLILLVAVTLLQLESSGKKQEASRYADATGAVDILAFSTGEGLKEYPYLRGQIGFENTILIEDMVLKCPDHKQGLWVAVLDSDFELLNVENFDIEADAGRLNSFNSFFRNSPLNTTAVLLIQRGLSLNEESGWSNYSNRFSEVALHAGYFDPGLPQYRKILGGPGWLAPERGAREDNTYSWTRGRVAEFSLWLAEPEDGIVYMRVFGVADDGPQRHVFLEINGNKLETTELPKGLGVVGFPVSQGQLKKGINSCVLSTERTVNPYQARGANDKRPLGVLVDYVQYQANSASLGTPDKDPHPDNKERLRGHLRPGLVDDAGALQSGEWFGREKGRDNRTYSWTRKRSVSCQFKVIDPGPGEIVIVGYGVPDNLGERYLSLKAGDQDLSTVIIPEQFGEMRFPVPENIGSVDTLDLTLELDRLTQAPGSDPRMLGVLVSEIRFERSGHNVNGAEGHSSRLWLDANRPVLPPAGSFSGLKMHLGWEIESGCGTPDIQVTISEAITGKVLYKKEIETSGSDGTTLEFPDDLPDSAHLYLGTPSAGSGQGVQLTEMVVGDASLSKITELFSELGAKVKPWQGKQASWTMVITRRPHGWVPLSESFSVSSGVMSAVTILPDRSMYDHYQGDFRRIE